MDYDQAIDVLETIQEVYPNFEITKRKAKILVPNLRKMNYDGVMKKLSDHVSTNPFPPKIAEIAVFEKQEDENLKKIEKWRKEAQQVPEEKKREFARQFKSLLEDKVL